jgi:SRSO17 transposase
LPKLWIEDNEKREATGVPNNIGFATKQQISLDQIRAAAAAGIPAGVTRLTQPTAMTRTFVINSACSI